MSRLEPWVVPVLTAAGGLVLCLLAAAVWLFWRRRSAAPGTRRGEVKMACSVCRRELVFHSRDLVPLSQIECGLAVRARPAVVGKRLAEYVCPHCEASHCFIVENRQTQWVGVNLYVPHQSASSAHCQECHKILRYAPWAPGEYPGESGGSPPMEPDYALVCSRCHAVSCAECCARHARISTRGVPFVCPRCSRYPLGFLDHL